MTEARLEDLLRAEDYPGCIQLLQECLKVAAAYRQFSCVSDMTNKLQDTLDMAEEQLDVGLSQVTSPARRCHPQQHNGDIFCPEKACNLSALDVFFGRHWKSHVML